MTDTRFQVIEESVSGHCCFEATVVDTSRVWRVLKDINGIEYPQYHQICECFDVEDARRIRDALNFTS